MWGGGVSRVTDPKREWPYANQSAAIMSDPVQIGDLTPMPCLPGATRAYHAMVKPVGAICNIDCTYCYYLHKE